MTIKDLRKLAEQETTKLNTDPNRYIRSITDMNVSHNAIRHLYKSDAELLDRVLCESQPSDGRFSSDKDQTDGITAVLKSNMLAICAWAKNPASGPKAVFVAPVYDEETAEPRIIGHGFVRNEYSTYSKIRKHQSSVTAVVLGKRPEREPDWILITAYPVTREREMPTNQYDETILQPVYEDFTDELHKTHIYDRAFPIQKYYLDYACSGKPMNCRTYVKFSKEDRHVVIYLRDEKNGRPSSDVSLTITKLGDRPPSIYLHAGESFTPIKTNHHMATLEKSYPDIVKTAKEILSKDERWNQLDLNRQETMTSKQQAEGMTERTGIKPTSEEELKANQQKGKSSNKYTDNED